VFDEGLPQPTDALASHRYHSLMHYPHIAPSHWRAIELT